MPRVACSGLFPLRLDVAVAEPERTGEKIVEAPGLERVGWIEGDPTCPGDWQSAVDGAEVVVHLCETVSIAMTVMGMGTT